MLAAPGVVSSAGPAAENDVTDLQKVVGSTCRSEIKRREGSWTLSRRSYSPEEIKGREVVLGYRERVGLLLLQLFLNGGVTDIVFVTLFCIAELGQQ